MRIVKVLLLLCGTSLVFNGCRCTRTTNVVDFEGFQWEALGQAKVLVTPDGLLVSNIGSAGKDGVRQTGPGEFSFTEAAHPFHRVIKGGLKNPDVPPGAYMEVKIFGTVKGSDQLISTFTATRCNKGRTGLTVDRSPIAPESLTVQYFRNSTAT